MKIVEDKLNHQKAAKEALDHAYLLATLNNKAFSFLLLLIQYTVPLVRGFNIYFKNYYKLLIDSHGPDSCGRSSSNGDQIQYKTNQNKTKEFVLFSSPTTKPVSSSRVLDLILVLWIGVGIYIYLL